MQGSTCAAAMTVAATPAGKVDRCSNGKGLGFDLLEDEGQRPHAKAIDLGEMELDAVRNEHDRIRGPRCQDEPMLRMCRSPAAAVRLRRLAEALQAASQELKPCAY